MALVLVPWALGCFSSNSAQQARLAIAAPAFAPALLALNTSAIYLGQAVGAAGGGALVAARGLWLPQCRGPGLDARRHRAEPVAGPAHARTHPCLNPLPAAAAPCQPHSPADLFRAFNRLALQGFGGVLPVAQRELVERQRWLTKAEFVELLSLGQVLPGPNIINMALIYGDRFFGWRGALAAGRAAGRAAGDRAAAGRAGAAGCDSPLMAGALRGMGVVAAGLILSTAAKVWGALKTNAMGLGICVGFVVATVVAIGVMRWPLVTVLLVLGPLAFATAWRKLR
jgi:chromate transporter